MLSSAVTEGGIINLLRAPRTIIHVRVAGEVDTLTAPMLDHALAPRPGIPPVLLVVDLREVTFLGVAGQLVLARTREWNRRTGTRLRVVGDGPAVRRALSVLDSVCLVSERYPR